MWSRRHTVICSVYGWTDQGKLVGMGPRDDVNAPDLYIPIMSFVTYVLVYGLALGLLNQ